MADLRLDFVGVGAAKAGTTWLARCLSEHPQICMSREKELNYFCTKHLWPQISPNNMEGESWLQSFFSHCHKGQIRGEVSPSYLVDPGSPRLIHQHSPSAKIIFSYRNPTASLYSLYHQFAKTYAVPNHFEDFLDEYPSVVQYGFYHRHTQRYLEFFPLDGCLFIVFDDIFSDPEQVVVDLFAFLGIETTFRPASLYERVNVRRAPRSTAVRNVVHLARVWLNSSHRALRIRRVVRRVGWNRLGDWILARNLRTAPPSVMKEETRDRLLEAYAEENLRLGEFLNRDLSHWNE